MTHFVLLIAGMIGSVCGMSLKQPPSSIPTVSYEQAQSWDEEIAAEGKTYVPRVSSVRWAVPNATFHPPIELELSNNCVGMITYNGSLFMGFRSAPFHFASNLTKIFIVRSDDAAQTFFVEATIELHSDAREPFFLRTPEGGLVFSFFQAGTDPLAFQPKKLLRKFRDPHTGQWSEAEEWGSPEEIAWQLGWFNGTYYAGSYRGNHYSITSTPNVTVNLNTSSDARTWTPTTTSALGNYNGGVSEVGLEFDLGGTLYGVMRNEDGDIHSGWGSRILRGRKGNIGKWDLFPRNESNASIYESPRMFRLGNELYLVGRREVNYTYWDHDLDWLPWEVEHDLILALYSLRAHRTSLYHLNKGSETTDPTLEYLFDLIGCGDTAFPSIIRVSKYVFVIANYTSPPHLCPNWSWIEGQISPMGSAIYLAWITFEPQA